VPKNIGGGEVEHNTVPVEVEHIRKKHASYLYMLSYLKVQR
jgi:hypothetical protein